MVNIQDRYQNPSFSCRKRGENQGKMGGGGCPKEGLEIPGKGGWGFRTQDTVSAEVSSDPAVTGPRVVGGLSGQESGLEEESPLDLS